jgi:hypothetical protein
MTTSDFEKSLNSTAHKSEAVAGQAKSAASDVKDTVVSGAASIDLSELRDEIAKLGPSVSGMVQDQATTARNRSRNLPLPLRILSLHSKRTCVLGYSRTLGQQ